MYKGPISFFNVYNSTWTKRLHSSRSVKKYIASGHDSTINSKVYVDITQRNVVEENTTEE